MKIEWRKSAAEGKLAEERKPFVCDRLLSRQSTIGPVIGRNTDTDTAKWHIV